MKPDAASIDYIDADVAYLLGLIVAKGAFSTRSDETRILIEFPFRAARMDGFDQFSAYVEAISRQVLPRIRALLGNCVELMPAARRVSLVIALPRTHLVVRNLLLLLSVDGEGTASQVPKVVTENRELAIEFMRGYADAAATVRRSNRDQRGINRVYVDVSYHKWSLACELCWLLQDVLAVPVHSILWSHPVLRGGPSHREHQLRVYSHAFVKVGFYLGFKQKLLDAAVKENEQMGAPIAEFCDGQAKRRIRKRRRHKDAALPAKLVGKPVGHYTDVCALLGCPRANAHREKRSSM